jgi:quercetin dioxygenase-like cupin family protein
MRCFPAFLLVIAGALFFLTGTCTSGESEMKPEKPRYIFTDNRSLPRDYALPEPIIAVEPGIFSEDSAKWEPAGEGAERKVFFNDRLTMVLLRIDRPVKPREEISCHYHVNDQVTYVLEGRLRVRVGEKTREIGAGGCYVVPSNVHHGIVTLSRKVTILDTFTPARGDFRPREGRQ